VQPRRPLSPSDLIVDHPDATIVVPSSMPKTPKDGAGGYSKNRTLVLAGRGGGLFLLNRCWFNFRRPRAGQKGWIRGKGYKTASAASCGADPFQRP
jgi:hypothetical protein